LFHILLDGAEPCDAGTFRVNQKKISQIYKRATLLQDVQQLKVLNRCTSKIFFKILNRIICPHYCQNWELTQRRMGVWFLSNLSTEL